MMLGKARVWLACVMMVIVMAVAAASKTPPTGTAASHVHHDGAGGAGTNNVQNTTAAYDQLGHTSDSNRLHDSHHRGVVADATPTPPLKLIWSRPVLVSGPTEALPAGPPVPDGFESFDNSHAFGVGNGGALMFTR